MKKQQNRKKKRNNKNQQVTFSKILLIQESLLIWIHSLAVIALAYICVIRGAYAELPWLTAMVSLPWTAYGVSQWAYYNKSKAENTKGGIVYESAAWENAPLPDIENEDARG